MRAVGHEPRHYNSQGCGIHMEELTLILSLCFHSFHSLKLELYVKNRHIHWALQLLNMKTVVLLDQELMQFTFYG